MFLLLVGSVAAAQMYSDSKLQLSLLGGVHALNQNNVSIPDNLLSVPAVGSIAYRITPTLALEGEFTWFFPLEQDVTMGSGATERRKSPTTLTYQAGVRGNLQAKNVSPYLTLDAGAMTFLADTDPMQLPEISETQTLFALSFGGGMQWGLSPRWGVRADFREFAAFPGSASTTFQSNESSDAIWMERGTIGLDYNF
jgi:hypothetical protein